jgi:hypothetical protein
MLAAIIVLNFFTLSSCLFVTCLFSGCLRFDVQLLYGVSSRTLHVVSNQSARAQSNPAADRGAGTRMTHSRADDSTSRGPAESANACALFPRGQ